MCGAKHMPKRLRFGPAGKPVDLKRADYVRAIEYIATEEGLDALEYEAVRGVRISQKKAMEIKAMANKYDVVLSLHAPYYINLSSPEKETVEKSIERLKAAVQAAWWMGAYAVVFHPGYYKGNSSREEAVKRVVEALKPVVEWMKQEGIKGVWLAPETTGKTSQVGDVDDVIEICRQLDMCRPAVDWAHIYARYEGQHILSKDDVLKVVEKFEKELGSEAVKPLHTHFSRIEHGKGGEREHHTLDETEYGPEFKHVCEAYKEAGVHAVIISESPMLDKDAIIMKRICCEEYGYC